MARTGLFRSLYRSFHIQPASHQSMKSMLVQTAISTLGNGLLSNDELLRTGLPPPKFQLSHSDGIDGVFASHSHIDPFQCVAEDLQNVSETLRQVVGSDHVVLSQIASYFFEVAGKRIRPSVVLLLSRAMNFGLLGTESKYNSVENSIAVNGSANIVRNSFYRVEADSIDPNQKRISEIAEMIHTASLLHDDVIDEAATRRSVATVNSRFGNKFAILGGDFLLSRASVALARLRNPTVVELMSMVVEHLVKGEIMQLKAPASSSIEFLLTNYVTKTYYKTASLLANSSKCAAILGSHCDVMHDIAYEYGRGMGIAFQIIDDILDCVGDDCAMGKAGGGSDLRHGILTAPVLFAMQASEEMRTMSRRKWAWDGDIDRAMTVVRSSGAIEKSRELANSFAHSACAAVLQLNPSIAQSALVTLIRYVLNRTS